MIRKVGVLVSLLGVLFMVTACGGEKEDASTTTVKWLTSRPVGGAIDETMREIADQYSKEKGGKWKIDFETTADRPSYLQKLKTLVAGTTCRISLTPIQTFTQKSLSKQENS